MISFELATKADATEIYNLINLAYQVEDGDTGIAFKNTPRLLDPFDSGMGDAYDSNSVIKAVKDSKVVAVIVYCVVETNILHFGPLAVCPSV